MLCQLFTGGNKFNGTIVTELGQIQNLTFLDLSGNHLSGIIPTELAKPSLLLSLDLRKSYGW